MTNEKLIALIRGGAEERLYELYKQNRGIIAKYARRYVNVEADPAIDMEDFMQEGYIALVAAVEAYDPQKGAFLNILTLYLRKQMREFAGLHTTRRHAHRHAKSLNVPIDGESEDELIDFLADPDALEAFDATENADQREAVMEAIARMKDDTRPVIEARYGIRRKALSLTQMADVLGLTLHQVNRLYHKGLRELRRDGRLRRAAEEYISVCYTHVGAESFRSSWTSAVELAAMQHERYSATQAYKFPIDLGSLDEQEGVHGS